MATAIDFAAMMREERAKAIAEKRLKAKDEDEAKTAEAYGSVPRRAAGGAPGAQVGRESLCASCLQRGWSVTAL